MTAMRGNRVRSNGWHCEHCDGYRPRTRVDERLDAAREVMEESYLDEITWPIHPAWRDRLSKVLIVEDPDFVLPWNIT